MKKLNSIEGEAVLLIDYFDSILARKEEANHVAILNGIRGDILQRYSHYIGNFSAESIISVTDSNYPVNHKALCSCYKSEGTVLAGLKKSIRDLQDKSLNGTCQYCGIGKPKTFDHYLPISLYPEFSVLAINLIPCCKDCNGKKHNYWKEDGARGIINFYLDDVEANQFLFANVEFHNEIPCVNFNLLNPDDLIDEELFQIISNHFNRLELLPLYRSEAPDELGEIIRNFKLYIQNPTFEFIQSKLKEDASELKAKLGVNYWRAAMRIALAESDDFLNYLIANELA